MQWIRVPPATEAPVGALKTDRGSSGGWREATKQAERASRRCRSKDPRIYRSAAIRSRQEQRLGRRAIGF